MDEYEKVVASIKASAHELKMLDRRYRNAISRIAGDAYEHACDTLAGGYAGRGSL